MFSVEHITDENIGLLKDFIIQMQHPQKSFRYFNTRTVDVIKNHLATLIFVDEMKRPIAYGHLDKENENTWLGICVLPGSRGKGYGNKMMQELLQNAKQLKIKSILLTVDKDNNNAIRMYENFHFIIIEETATYYKYALEMNN